MASHALAPQNVKKSPLNALRLISEEYSKTSPIFEVLNGRTTSGVCFSP